jgi:hypothetical protein
MKALALFLVLLCGCSVAEAEQDWIEIPETCFVSRGVTGYLLDGKCVEVPTLKIDTSTAEIEAAERRLVEFRIGGREVFSVDGNGKIVTCKCPEVTP